MNLTNEQIQELLGRTYSYEDADVTNRLHDKTVLVTGAGGSIGSELVIEIARQIPKTLLMYESNEFNLYQIERKIRELKLGVKIVPVLGDLSNSYDVARMLYTYNIERVYHAAAYKHVPMVERNPIAGIRNNVLATELLVDCCRSFGVSSFTFVSTDKAVRPSNIMGATKRLAEYVVLSADYKVVRFGNVLGSAGSVLPLFCEQIMQGQPLTITHKDVTRYFMSVQEAVGLILQSEGCESRINVLDMGVQVKIEDLGHRLCHMLGKTCKVKYVGLRPGEKMYEELTLGDSLVDTEIEHIKSATEVSMTRRVVRENLHQLSAMCMSHNVGGIRDFLKQVVPGYAPSCGIVDDLWLEENVYTALFEDCYQPTKGVDHG